MMKRRFRIATAKQVRSTDAKRAATHQAQAAAIQRRQKRYNNEVAMTQCEVILKNTFKLILVYMFIDVIDVMCGNKATLPPIPHTLLFSFLFHFFFFTTLCVDLFINIVNWKKGGLVEEFSCIFASNGVFR